MSFEHMSTPAKEPKKTTNITDYIPPYQGKTEGIELSEAEELTEDLIERPKELGGAVPDKPSKPHQPASWLVPETEKVPASTIASLKSDIPKELLETEGGEAIITGGTTAEMGKFNRWEQEIGNLDPQRIPEFIKKLDAEMAKDQFIQTYPELKLDYLKIRKAALARAGAAGALKILTPEGTVNPINPIIAELETAEKTPNDKEKTYLQAKATLELTVIEKACQQYLKTGKITIEQWDKIKLTIDNARKKLEAIKEAAAATYH